MLSAAATDEKFPRAAFERPHNEAEREEQAAELHDYLRDVGPDHGLHAAERGVGDGDDAHHQDAPNHVEAGDGRNRQRREKQDHAHASAEVHQDAHAARRHAHGTMESLVEVGKHRHQLKPSQQRHDAERHEDECEHVDDVAEEILPVRRVGLRGRRDVADRTRVRSVEADAGRPEWNRATADEERRGRLLLLAHVAPIADGRDAAEVSEERHPIERSEQLFAAFQFAGHERRRSRRIARLEQQAIAPSHAALRSARQFGPLKGEGTRHEVKRRQPVGGAGTLHRHEQVSLADRPQRSVDESAGQFALPRPTVLRRPSPERIRRRLAHEEEHGAILRHDTARDAGDRPRRTALPRAHGRVERQVKPANRAGGIGSRDMQRFTRDRPRDVRQPFGQWGQRGSVEPSADLNGSRLPPIPQNQKGRRTVRDDRDNAGGKCRIWRPASRRALEAPGLSVADESRLFRRDQHAAPAGAVGRG
ncbi:MAG: hypothetical protein QM736_06005 [Vicinamibacterales bacterium]